MANGLPLIVWVHDAAGEQIMVNDTFCEFFGVTREEMKGGKWQVLMHPEDAEAYANEFFACVRDRRPFHAEVRVKRADGAWRWIESWGRPRIDESGGFRGFVGASADITDRKHAEAALRQANRDRKRREQALRASEERYRTLFETIEQGFCILEMLFDDHGVPVDYRFLETNPAFERHTGLVDAAGKRARELVPNLEDRWLEVYGRVAVTGEPFQFTLDSEAMDGRYFEVSASRVGEPAARRVALLFTEITGRRRAEQALRESEERFRTLADNMSQLAWMADETGTIFWYNQRWYDYTGTSPEEMRRQGWPAVLHPDQVDRVVDRLQHSWETGEPWEDLFPLTGTGGRERWFLSRALPIRDPEGAILRWFGTHTDVTEQRQAEERLRESDRRKDEYLAMLGHELRNPLAAVQSATELLDLSNSGNPRVERATGVLQRQAGHMARLIDGLLEVSRIARGKIDLDCDTLDLRAVLEAVLEDRRAQIAARGLELETAFPGEPLWVFGDHVRLAQVFDNLLGNALKFTEAPGQITVHLHSDGGRAVASLEDTGAGIRPEMLSRIFEPFQQEVQDISRAAGGLGLGLALASGLVELHRGTIEAHSAGLGAGASFEVRLPLAAAPPAQDGQAEPAARGPARRILIVEDNADAAEMLRELLEMHGHEVTAVGSGPDALKALECRAADLVLCDLGLPGMSGYELAREIRTAPALHDLPVVALTGYGQPEDRQRTAAAGFDDHLIKPVDIRAVERVLARLDRPRL